MEVSIKTTGDCWIGVKVDGKEDFSGTLRAGDSKTFSGKEKINMILGNAGAAEISINGQPQPPPGRKGEVVSLEVIKGPEGVKVTKRP
ncbi:MAG TPA: DUF4115 domain-containing protein [Moorella mulderi]|nr:DUF4115 domain-containing protein [Moorella mulderi]